MVSDLKKYFRRNAAAISAGEFLWGIGLPVVMESTFVTVFLSILGATNTQIGLSGLAMSVSFAIVPLFAAFFTSKMPYKKGPTVWLQVIASAGIIFMGLAYIFTGSNRNAYIIFILFYSFFAVGISSTIPVWQNFIVKIFTPSDSIRGMSIMMFAQNSAKLISGFILALVIGKTGISVRTAGFAFLIAGLTFLAGSLAYAYAKENRDDIGINRGRNIFGYFTFYIRHILKNRNMILFLLQDIEFSAVVVFISFYSRYAIDYCGITASTASGIFIIMLFTGAVLSNILLGFTKNIPIKKCYLAIKICTLLGMAALILFRSEAAFFATSLMLGFSRSGRIQLYGPAVKGISALEDASPYYAIGPLIIIPVTSLLPVGMGTLLDKLAFMKGAAFTVGFACLFAIAMLSLIPFAAMKLSNIAGEKASPPSAG
jgi:MFS family permease